MIQKQQQFLTRYCSYEHKICPMHFDSLCDVISHVTIQLLAVSFLWVVHSDQASVWHRYRDMAPQILDKRTWTWKER